VDLKALASRELPPLPPQRLTPPGGAFSGEVEATAAPTFEPGEGPLRLTVPLGTGSPLTCFVYTGPIDAGAALWRMVESVSRSVEVQQARTTEVLGVAGVPTVFLEVEYLSATGQGRAAGLLKLMVHASPTLPLLCLHDEVGYGATFQRITQGLAASLRATGEPPEAPRASELHVVRLGAQPVGFLWRTQRAGPGGQPLVETHQSLLLPRSHKALTAQDTTMVELGDTSGRLLARSYAHAVEGEVKTRVSLELTQGREYHYEGRHEGQELSGTLTAPQGLFTEQGQARAVREQLLTGKVQELRLETWWPSRALTTVTPVVWRKQTPEGRDVTLSVGTETLPARVDEQGQLEHWELPVGGLRLTVARDRLNNSH
jgi:hypothetical protein